MSGSTWGLSTWARANAEINGLGDAPVRWIVDDVQKFMQREVRRGSRYDAIVLDPPTFGRGRRGEVFKVETHLWPVLDMCRSLLSDHPVLVLLSCHTPGYTPVVLSHILEQALSGLRGSVEAGEMLLSGRSKVRCVPSGAFARWELLRTSSCA